MKLSEDDIRIVRSRYQGRLQEYGYSPKALGWDKGKQNVRFDILTSQYDCDGKRFLDIGCGFGDLVPTLSRKCKSFTYFGIDIVPELIEIARQRHQQDFLHFESTDFLAADIDEEFDYAIASGTFNFKLTIGDNYNFVKATMKKAFEHCKDGLAFDFLSDKVDYRYKHTFHYNPETILKMAYSFSRNIVLKNDYMPFEFSLFVFKDDSFSKEDTLFSRYKLISSD